MSPAAYITPPPPPPPPFAAPQNERGISPLGVAVGFNRKPVVALLLDAGADLEARDAAGNTVLHYAAGE
jgi:ankyrin repeat protein